MRIEAREGRRGQLQVFSLSIWKNWPSTEVDGRQVSGGGGGRGSSGMWCWPRGHWVGRGLKIVVLREAAWVFVAGEGI